ncbi:hypothetical protein, partial [Myroides odoratimimus]|uniref:hypothetical protein n=1 Tax=Myroides odoratimimus TaxID=76832 RepID=UPI0029C084B8
MIKKIIPLTALFFSGYVTAQVGVGTKKPADATMLDVTATDKGVLLPRVNLLSQTDNTTVKGKLIESLLVYNIGSSNLKAGFYYWFENKWTPLMSGAIFTDTTNKSFTISEDQERLVITDTENNKVELEIKDIAKNSVFVTNLTENSEFVTKLVENKEFIKKLGDNIEFVENITNNQEFIENIINKLEGDFGNVGYDKDKNQFFYLKDGKVNYIDWSDLDTVNVKFSFDDAKANLVITDSKGGVVSISTDELGETIAKNSVFVTNLTENSEFVTKLVENKEFIKKLGDNIEFVENITNNQEFIENIINKLEGDFGNVGYDKDKNQFFYLKDGKVNYIDWSDLDTVNVKFSFDDAKTNLVITDSKGGVVSISTDELGETIAKNSVFVTNLTENSEFVTKLVENKEFITKLGDNIEFVENIINNQEFIENIINKLEGDFGNVGYDKDKNQFFYLKDGKVNYIDWSDLDTVNVKFSFDDAKANLVITDSKGGVVSISTDELGETIAKNSVFVTNLTENSEFVTKLVENKEFITKLGDNIEFVENITNNQEFIENIINKLEGDFGNVGYDKDKNQFFYLKDGKVNYIDWSDLDTVNVKFSFDDGKTNLVITDSKGGVVSISTDELGETIAKNSVFVTNLTENSEFVTKLVENKEFITKLGDNIEFVENITNNQEFIENIINKLEGDFGNVGYDKDKNQFFYLKDGKVNYIDWSDLDTVNAKFSFDDVKANLVITDSKGGVVSISTDELGETIAKNSVFVTNLTENSEFVTKLVENKEFIKKLGDNIEFVENITNNQEFIENIINKLEGDFGNVGYDKDKNQFFYLKDGKVNYIDWSDLDTVNAKFSFDDTKANLVITDSKGGVVSISTDELGETIAKNSVFVTNLTENKEFITKLVENKEFITEITNNQEFIENIINKLEGDFGNVGYDKDKNQFFYLKDGKVNYIDWSDLDTVNAKFSFDDTKANLVITDSKGGVVSISTDELGETIAKNSVFVTNLTENSEFVTKLVENKEFIKKLGDNIEFVENITNNQEFIENIINKLEGDFGNVGYDKDKNQFFYLKDGKVNYIDWSDLDTVNAKFSFDDTKANLVITDSKGGVVSISTDELGETIAKNSVFVTNLTENSEFVTKLVENKEFITEITNNQEFIENVINKLEGQYGNVGYDVAKNEFFYIDTDGSVKPISWSDLDTVNAKFSFDDTKANLVITDSKGGVVSISTDELGETIAKNDVFVTNLTDNKEFITKLVENKEFITEITNNQEFIENVINKLEGQYGNVGYDVAKNEFFYIDTDGSVKPISWSDLDTVNAKFSFDDTKANLVITDSKGGVVSISTDELGETIAKNSVFVTNLTENKEFITKLIENKEFITEITNNQEFIENVINKLEGQYGNVGYDVAKNEFFYIDTDGSVKPISWSDLDTVNAKFSFDDTKANLVITDSKGGVVSISTDELGETIAKNSVFVTNLTENKEFVTKLVENKEFITEITNNQEFIENIINKLEGQYGNVVYDEITKEFTYIKQDGSVGVIDWSAAVKSVETETTLIAEKDASDKLTGKYTYTNE